MAMSLCAPGLVPRTAHAQGQEHSPARRPVWVDTATRRLIDDGRERMRAGDCVGALDAFDEALQSSMDPSVRRDRGLCHERLGHTYPAIDDLRAYVTAAPDAPDVATIRDHLERLMDDASPGATAAPARNDDIPPAAAALDTPEPVSTEAVPPPEPEREAVEIPRSSLRADAGFGVAALFSGRKWVREGRSFGDGETWSEVPAFELRYSFSARGALLVDVGYEIFNATDADVEHVSGFASALAYEVRLPLGASYDDQITIAPGAGFEYLVFVPNDTTLPGYAEAGLSGRARAGYRRMLGPSTSLDVALEGGVAWFFKAVHPNRDMHDPAAGFVGLTLGFEWGP
jgi:Tetratricopeptide repeat